MKPCKSWRRLAGKARRVVTCELPRGHEGDHKCTLGDEEISWRTK